MRWDKDSFTNSYRCGAAQAFDLVFADPVRDTGAQRAGLVEGDEVMLVRGRVLALYYGRTLVIDPCPAAA